MDSNKLTIRVATQEDCDAIWEIFHEVIQKEDTYVFDSNTPKEDLAAHWFAPYMKTFVAEVEGKILGTYIIKPNQIDLGAHVANCSYMVHHTARGKGIGGKMCEHSIDEAKRIGYRAIQFNIVVATNKSAVKLWEKFGFEIIGTAPKSFKLNNKKFVDSHIMFKSLTN